MEVRILLQIHQKGVEPELKTLPKCMESDISVTNNQKELNSAIKLPEEKRRLNVIILTHMSSGSSFTGNIFNFHPDVFYLYEPLHDLRRLVYGDEWHPLNSTANGAYKADFENLLRDLFTCGFKEETTLPRIFPEFLRDSKLPYMYWRISSPELTNDAVRDACLAKKITVAKLMQTRLPREIGIQELERLCRSDPTEFDCLIIHLVRDPRAVLSSLLRRKFFFKDSKRQLFDSENLTTEAKEIIQQNARLICSQVVDNLNYVKGSGSNWFQRRYKLLRYEDLVTNVSLMVDEMYNFVGLPMVDAINKWLVESKPLLNITKSQFSLNDVSRMNSWRLDRDPWLVSLFEEACAPLMKLMGYISVNDPDHIDSKRLITKEIPLLKDTSFN